VIGRDLIRPDWCCCTCASFHLGAGRVAPENFAELSPQTFCTFPREFSSERRKGVGPRSDFVPEPGSADLLVPRAIPRPPGCRPRMYKPVAVRSDSRSTRPRTAEGHISRHADRLASTRARRAAAARYRRFAGTASPLPKYISSGVCP
jgi:hypothetical protein